MREAAADLSHPVSAHRSWRQLPLGRRKRAVCPRSLLAVKQAASLDAWFPCLPWGRVQGLLPADSRLVPPKPAGSGWLWHRSMDRFGSANRVGISSPSAAPKPRAALLPHPALRKGAPEGGTPGPPAWQGLPPGSKCGRQPPGKPGSGASALLAREKGAGCSSPLPACKGF